MPDPATGRSTYFLCDDAAARDLIEAKADNSNGPLGEIKHRSEAYTVAPNIGKVITQLSVPQVDIDTPPAGCVVKTYTEALAIQAAEPPA